MKTNSKRRPANVVGIYTVYDRKMEIFQTPMFLMNDAVAMRSIQLSVNNPETMIYHYPEDYVLKCVGEFDVNTGQLFPQDPEEICYLSELKIKKEVIEDEEPRA